MGEEQQRGQDASPPCRENIGWTFFGYLSISCGADYIWNNFWLVRLFVPLCLQTQKWQRWQCSQEQWIFSKVQNIEQGTLS